jgi:5'-3' exonuclease
VATRTLHLVDGTYELFRAYYAVPSRKAPGGQEVGAVQGVLASLLALLRSPEVTHVAVATDHVVESFRNRLFDGYKTGAGIEAGLLGQFPLLEEGLRALGLVVWPMVEFEADDALATAARKYRRGFDRIVIATPDKDLAQCVEGARVVQWDRRREIVLDEQGVRDKFGVGPPSIPHYLALVGDAADGFPGLPGFGARTAATLLAEYETLDRIPDDEREWTVKVRGAARLAETLRTRRREAALYLELATLRTDVPLAESKADLAWRGAPRAPWQACCESWGLGRLRDRPGRWR